jgi:Domain of unknown function (DUF4105)
MSAVQLRGARFRSFAWKLLVSGALAPVVAWGALALWFDGPAERRLAGLLAGGFAVGCLALLACVRPFLRAAMAVLLALVVVVAWWLSIAPSNDRVWLPEVARLPTASFDGSLVTIRNVRNFDYRSETDFTEGWETRTYDLDQLRGFDMFLSYWSPTLIAHTIASWEFGDGLHLAVSIETRKEKGESYSALRGFFRQFELYYVVADERDVIGVRALHRGERVFLYRLKTPRAQARALLVEYLGAINRLAESPAWYNALTQSCTTTIRHHAKQVAAARPWSWKILANGYLDELGYDRGTLDTSLPFPELKRRSEITERAKAAAAGPEFARRIRQGLPGMDAVASRAEPEG